MFSSAIDQWNGSKCKSFDFLINCLPLCIEPPPIQMPHNFTETNYKNRDHSQRFSPACGFLFHIECRHCLLYFYCDPFLNRARVPFFLSFALSKTLNRSSTSAAFSKQSSSQFMNPSIAIVQRLFSIFNANCLISIQFDIWHCLQC